MARIPAYKAIQNDILTKLANGQLYHGERIPTEAELMEQYNVSRITVQHAMDELKQRGVIVRKPRAGTFIKHATMDMPAPVAREDASTERVNLSVVAPFDLTEPNAYQQYLTGIIGKLSTPRDNVTLHNTNYVEAYDRIMLQNSVQDGCNGIIYYPGVASAPPLDFLMQMEAQGFPCVLIDKRLPGVDLPCVQTNNIEGARVITNQVIARGHRNIAFLIGKYAMSVYERYKGFCLAMKEAQLSALELQCCSLPELDRTGRGLDEQLKIWLRQGVTAVCCDGDDHAKQLLTLCREQGVEVPGQLAIVGFDGAYPGEITSMLQPYAQIGSTATDILLRWILTGEVERQVISLDATLVEGITL